jgi:hypothetical protein
MTFRGSKQEVIEEIDKALNRTLKVINKNNLHLPIVNWQNSMTKH